MASITTVLPLPAGSWRTVTGMNRWWEHRHLLAMVSHTIQSMWEEYSQNKVGRGQRILKEETDIGNRQGASTHYACGGFVWYGFVALSQALGPAIQVWRLHEDIWAPGIENSSVALGPLRTQQNIYCWSGHRPPLQGAPEGNTRAQTTDTVVASSPTQ